MRRKSFATRIREEVVAESPRIKLDYLGDAWVALCTRYLEEIVDLDYALVTLTFEDASYLKDSSVESKTPGRQARRARVQSFAKDIGFNCTGPYNFVLAEETGTLGYRSHLHGVYHGDVAALTLPLQHWGEKVGFTNVQYPTSQNHHEVVKYLTKYMAKNQSSSQTVSDFWFERNFSCLGG